MVEMESDEILRDADKEDVSLLVVGDPFGLGLSSYPILHSEANCPLTELQHTLTFCSGRAH
jgi:hypothetical protein